MKNIIQEEINRTKQLMGVISESNLVLEEKLTRRQKNGLANCAVFGGGFWCLESANECAKMLESGEDCKCNPDSPGCGDKTLNPNDLLDKDMKKEPVNEELLTEGKKFWKHLNACRDEIAAAGPCKEQGDDDYNDDCDGGGKKCSKFFRKYG